MSFSKATGYEPYHSMSKERQDILYDMIKKDYIIKVETLNGNTGIVIDKLQTEIDSLKKVIAKLEKENKELKGN